MGMYIMNGKTFLKTYINEDPDTVLDTQFVLVSSLIRKAGRYEKQVINAANVMYPPTLLILDYEDKTDPMYEELYMEHLDDVAKPFLATIIQFSIDNPNNVVFLCSKKEWSYRYLQIASKYILDRFGVHVYDYKKVKDGKEKIVEDDESYISSICRKVLKQAQKNRIARMKQTEKGLHDYLDELDKKDLIKKLKKRNLYIKGMSRAEMIDTLLTFM